ncbi:entericidin A/B family lipoprotein [Andreprevotia chitinilytica]
MKRISLLAILLATLAVTGCNTMKGFGQDLQKGGEKIENSAERHS